MNDAELIKSKIDIVDYLSSFITLKKAGRHFKALCPFHTEKTPSFVVSPERQTWHCFGACAIGGDVISFLQKWDSLEFVEALKILAEKTGVQLSSYTPPESVKRKERLYEMHHLAGEYYHYLLTRHKIGEKARSYLKQRNVSDKLIVTFMLGYAPDSWDSLSRFLHRKGYRYEEIAEAGLSVKSAKGGYYDRFRGRLVFALKDSRGKIIAFSGRVLPPADEKEAKYINSPETPLYIKGSTLFGLDVTREYIRKQNSAIVVEGEFDMMSSFQAGVTNIVAIKGSALTEGHVLLLKRYTETLILALDSDIAGNEAAQRGIEIADGAGLQVKVIRIENGKDPDECIRKTPHIWKEAVNKPVSVYDFIIEKSLSKYQSKDAWGKKKISDETVPFLRKISNPVVRSHYIKYLAGKLDVTEASIEELIDSKGGVKSDVPPEKKAVPANRVDLLEHYLLSLLLQVGEDAGRNFRLVRTYLNQEDVNQPAVRKIMGILDGYFRQNDKLEIRLINTHLTGELADVFDKAYLSGIAETLEPVKLLDELSKTVVEIRKNSIRREINDLSTKIKKWDVEKQDEKTNSANDRIKELLKQLSGLENFKLVDSQSATVE